MAIFNCTNCGKEFNRPPSRVPNPNKIFCDRQCYGKYNTGKNNPNHGKSWSDEQKVTQSNLIKSKVDSEYREKCSTGMKGKSVSEETKQKRNVTISERYPDGIKRNHSNETKKLIGAKSSAKFTDEFKREFRKKMESEGHWTPLDELDDYHFYCRISNWNYNVFEFEPNGIDKLNELGIYSNDNINGLVRDHIYSRKSGFNNNVFPEIIQHPVNCQLIPHGENVSKQQNKSIESDWITLEELFERVLAFDKPYDSQELCIKLIADYKQGKRYKKENYLS